MRRAVLVVLGVAGALVALVLAAVAIALATVDVNSFADPLAERVRAATGRSFTLGGPLALKLSLEPTLSAQDVTLGNAPWGSANALLKAGRVEAQVALLPLLQRRFEIVRITLVDPVISLETDVQGRGNWVFGAAADGAAPSPGAALVAAPVMGIGEVEVRNGMLSYRDGTTGKVTPVAIDTLLVHSRDPPAPILAEFRGSVGGVPLALKANLGSRAALVAQQWPFPIALTGEIAGRNATLAAKITPKELVTTLDDTSLAFGQWTMQGRIAIDRSGPRVKYHVDLRMPNLAPEALAVPAVAAAGRPAANARAPAPNAADSGKTLFDDPLPLDALRAFDADGSIAIDRVDLPHGQGLDRVQVSFALKEGRLELSDLEAAGLGGTLAAHGALQAGADGRGALDLRIDGRDLDLSALLALGGAPRAVTGGKTRASIDVRANGASPQGWVSTLDGTALLMVGAAQVPVAAGAGSALDQLGEAIDPLRRQPAGIALRCVVVRLPLRDGIARVDRSIALETAEIGLDASGTVDFRNETLDLALRPKLRQGVALDLSQIAGLVHVRGPFAKPQIEIDPVKSAEALARIGAAVGAGGRSLLGAPLADTHGDGDSPCAIALGARSPAPASANAPAASAAAPLQDLGKALGRLLGR